MTVGPITEAIYPAALDRLARDAADPKAAVADFHALLVGGTLDSADVFAAQAQGRVTGVIFAQRLGGAQAAVWLPVADDEDTADALVKAIVAHLIAAGHRILQAVVRIPPPALIASLQRVGFVFISDLVFLSRDLSESDAALPSTRMRLRPAALDDLEFARIIDRTYLDSQDMPELNETRSVEELLTGLQHSAKVEPPLWWYAVLDGQPVGALQLATGENDGDYELVYMGLVPAARGRKLGGELARIALTAAAGVGATRLRLSRDVRNRAAARIYDQLGFHETSRRGVWIKIWRDSL